MPCSVWLFGLWILELSLQLRKTKLVPSTQCITQFNSLTMMLSLPADKLSTFQEVITGFLGWKHAASSNCLLVSHLGQQIIFVYLDNAVVVATLNKGTNKSPTMMHFQRGLFWLSAVYNFYIKTFYVAGKPNVLADNISCLHEPLHLQGLFSCLLASGSDAGIISVVSHMSVATYFWLLGTYSLPLKKF